METKPKKPKRALGLATGPWVPVGPPQPTGDGKFQDTAAAGWVEVRHEGLPRRWEKRRCHVNEAPVDKEKTQGPVPESSGPP